MRVFAGRDRGRAVRNAAQLDAVDQADATVEVRVPDDVYSINSSFFLGMFGKSVRNLGAEEFRRRYHFVGEDLHEFVEEGIREALDTSSPL